MPIGTEICLAPCNSVLDEESAPTFRSMSVVANICLQCFDTVIGWAARRTSDLYKMMGKVEVGTG